MSEASASGASVSGAAGSGSPGCGGDWGRYLAEYHDGHPGITEQVFATARDANGRTPYEWLAEAVPADAAIVVDLACGSGPVARLLPSARVVGVDQSAGELAVARAAGAPGLLVRARATAVPVTDGGADAVVSSLALMVMAPLEGVLREVRRLLRPGGTFVATVPVRALGAGEVFTEILDALGQAGTIYPEDLDGRTLPGRFSAAALTLQHDETGLFTRTIGDEADAAVVVRSFYAPGADDTRLASAVAHLERRVRSAPMRIGYRVRRLVVCR